MQRGTAIRWWWCAPFIFAATVAAYDAAGPSAFYPADAGRGKPLATACLACHGAQEIKFEGEPFHVPRIGGQRPDSIFDALLEYKNGARPSSIMAPIAAALSDQQMRDVAAYLAGAQIKPAPGNLPDSWAHTRVHEDCAACHGETGLGVMPGYPILGGQHADYLAYALRAFRGGQRRNPTMRTMAHSLTDSQIDELARFFEDRGYLRTAE